MTADGLFIGETPRTLPALGDPMPAGVRHVGYDGRGWVILDALWSGPGVKTISMEVNHKPLTLVSESSVPLREYVNPMLGEGDEWEKPPGSGSIVEGKPRIGGLEEHEASVEKSAASPLGGASPPLGGSTLHKKARGRLG